jgi:hypothetical protein
LIADSGASAYMKFNKHGFIGMKEDDLQLTMGMEARYKSIILRKGKV